MSALYQRKDAYYRKAKQSGYRSRAAYKLEDLLRKLPALGRGSSAVDLGCWPGAWLQVLAERVGPGGRVVGVDLQATEPLPDPVRILQFDFTESGAAERIAEALDGRRAELLLCDAAPKLTGVRDVDRAVLEELWEAALHIAEECLDAAGGLVIKGFPGAPADAFRKRLRARFGRVSEVRPEAKRATSKEFYWVAMPRTSTRRRSRA